MFQNQLIITHYQMGVYSVLNSKPVEVKPMKAEQLIEMSSMLNISYALERIAGNVRLYLRIAHNFRKTFLYDLMSSLPQLIESKYFRSDSSSSYD